MRVRHISIRNFRGIREADWSISSHFICLIGQGDCGKSTVLDAIGLALNHRWSVPVTDADFFECDTSQTLSITVTISDLPATMTREDPYGYWLRGIAEDGSVLDEPDAKAVRALSVRFSVDDTLEPRWELWKEAMEGQEKTFYAKERSQLGVFQIDDRFDAHLKWAQGSALSHLSGEADVGALLAKAQREARACVFNNQSQILLEAAGKASERMLMLGGAVFADPRPGLDPSGLGRSASLVLHDNDVPATQLGLGSRRLASLAFQLAAVKEESIVLIDEVEYGLEPHRLLHVLDHLRKRAASNKGQVILTTHSPLVVEAVGPAELHVVRKQASIVTVLQVPEEIADMKMAEPQATIRSGPSAMLSKRIIVCEGKTEVGICRALAKYWDVTAKVPLALIGTSIRNGWGTEAPTKARCLATLGYQVALLVDNDLSGAGKTAFDADVAKAIAVGVELIAWQDGYSVETQVTDCLSPVALAKLLELAASFQEIDNPEEAICSTIAAQCDGATLSGLDPAEWSVQSGKPLSEIRIAIAAAAKKKKWFKDETRGEQLGELLLTQFDALDPQSALMERIERIRLFAFDIKPEPVPEHDL